MTKTHHFVEQIFSPKNYNAYQTLQTTKNELWKIVRLTSFQKPQLRSVLLFLSFHQRLLSFSLCYLYFTFFYCTSTQFTQFSGSFFHFYAFYLSEWTFPAVSMPVIFGCVFIFFQTQTSLPKQSTYAPVIVMGSGVSIMYVMALTLATELTGKYKVHVSCYYTNSNHTLLEDDRNLRAKTTSSL